MNTKLLSILAYLFLVLSTNLAHGQTQGFLTKDGEGMLSANSVYARTINERENLSLLTFGGNLTVAGKIEIGVSGGNHNYFLLKFTPRIINKYDFAKSAQLLKRSVFTLGLKRG